ncbi:restriction endonuclease [Tissierella praeacuta]|uniref:restriction endonuclease n=1 Tax=Tissierella praeacuta TaxID=43131 RepID=UPI003DA3ADAC
MGNKIDFNGVIFDIFEVERNKILSNKREQISRIYTLIRLKIINKSNEEFYLSRMNLKLIDDEGNQYDYVEPNWAIRDVLFVSGYTDPIRTIPNAKIKTIITFPEILDNNKPKFFYYSTNVGGKTSSRYFTGFIKIDLETFTAETNASRKILEDIDESYYKEQRIREKTKREESENKKKEKEYIKHKSKVDALGLLVHSRVNNVLTYKELVKIENSIMNLILEIKNMEVQNKELKDKFLLLESEYYNHLPYELGNFIDFNEKYSVTNMTPKEFEVYTFEKFKSMGYSPVLTSEFLDEGIDIILTKDNNKYGVQCKYFNPNRYVGTNIVLHFLGALVNINADYGFLVTTGKITKAAQFIADRNKIQIIKLII